MWNRYTEGDKYSKLRANFYDKLIKGIDEKRVDWKAKEIREQIMKNYKETFWKEIGEKGMGKESKKWHKQLKKLTNYTKKSNILDLKKGPIAIRKEWIEANEKKRKMEEVRITSNEEEIREQ